LVIWVTFTALNFRNIVPGTILCLLLPYFYFIIFCPVNNQSGIQHKIGLKLAVLGMISKKEIHLLGILVFCLVFWVFGSYLDISTTFVAMVSLFAIITFNIMSWNDVVKNYKAWDSFFWLSLMIKLSQQISDSGLAKSFGDSCASTIISMNLDGFGASFLLAIIYFLTMYLFSSITAYDFFFC
jgi:DASS family divalent anion:Na+ symporter